MAAGEGTRGCEGQKYLEAVLCLHRSQSHILITLSIESVFSGKSNPNYSVDGVCVLRKERQ